MYIPSPQSILAAGLALSPFATLSAQGSSVAKGSIMDYEVEQCLDSQGNQRCSKPFLVTKSTCYEMSWSTDGILSHTTMEVRDAGSNEMIYYADTNGEWTPEKGELVILDFKPKVYGQGNKTVDYEVKMCADKDDL